MALRWKSTFRRCLPGLLAGALLLPSGCGSKNRAERAPNPPPPTLSKNSRERSVPKDEYAFLEKRQAPAREPLPQVAPTEETESRAAVVSEPPLQVQQTAAAAPAAGANLSGQTYVMQKGDTLYAVARKFNVPPKKLVAANNFPNPDKISVGTQVRIPN